MADVPQARLDYYLTLPDEIVGLCSTLRDAEAKLSDAEHALKLHEAHYRLSYEDECALRASLAAAEKALEKVMKVAGGHKLGCDCKACRAFEVAEQFFETLDNIPQETKQDTGKSMEAEEEVSPDE